VANLLYFRGVKARFFKYHGTGNDFVMMDNRSGEFRLTKEQVIRLCDRHFGIGSDGLILVGNSEEADFDMDFFNPDASKSFCGNGSRCAVHFAQTLGMIEKTCTFKAIDGIHEAVIDGPQVRIRMQDTGKLSNDGIDDVLHTGSPHFIRYVENVDSIDLQEMAKGIRFSEKYRAQGINVNLVQVTGPASIKMRTYERGVEDETLSCGTGVTAAALSFGHRHPGVDKVEVSTRGGLLGVEFSALNAGGFSNTWLSGPAQCVFEGEIEL